MVSEARDLGIIVDNRANIRPQQAVVVKKVKAKTAWMLRTFRSRDLKLMRSLWVTLVRPHQDYGSQLWAPVSSLMEIRAQEAPLRAFTKRITGLRLKTKFGYTSLLQ